MRIEALVAGPPHEARKPLYRLLYVQGLIGLVLGIAIGRSGPNSAPH